MRKLLKNIYYFFRRPCLLEKLDRLYPREKWTPRQRASIFLNPHLYCYQVIFKIDGHYYLQSETKTNIYSDKTEVIGSVLMRRPSTVTELFLIVDGKIYLSKVVTITTNDGDTINGNFSIVVGEN